MTRRYIVFAEGENDFLVSQEFNGSRSEQVQLTGSSRLPGTAEWDTVLKLLKDANIEDGLDFASSIYKAENLYYYHHEPLRKLKTKESYQELCFADEVWAVIDHEPVLILKSGEQPYESKTYDVGDFGICPDCGCIAFYNSYFNKLCCTHCGNLF